MIPVVPTVLVCSISDLTSNRYLNPTSWGGSFQPFIINGTVKHGAQKQKPCKYIFLKTFR